MCYFVWRFCSQTIISGLKPDLVDKIPGRLNDRRTPLGELNWIFTAITDTIAWNSLPRRIILSMLIIFIIHFLEWWTFHSSFELYISNLLHLSSTNRHCRGEITHSIVLFYFDSSVSEIISSRPSRCEFVSQFFISGTNHEIL